MTVNIPVSVKKITDDLPKIKAEMAALDAQQKKAIKDHLSQVSFQRRVENEINRELKEQIAQRRRLTTLTNKLNRDMQGQKGGLLGGGIGQVAGALGIGFSVQQAIEFGKASEEMGRALEANQKQLVNTLGSVSAYNQAIAEAREKTKGMTSEADLAQGMFIFLNAGLADNAEQASNLARAQSILIPTFEKLGANEEKFIRLLSGGSIQLYDNFNLTQDVVNARKEYIQKTEGVSAAEAKQRAIKQLLIEKANELEGSLTEDTIAARQFQSASEDLQAHFGQLLIPSMTNARKVLADLFSTLDNSVQSWKTAQDNVSILVEAQKRLEQQTGNVNQVQDTWVGGIYAGISALNPLVGLIGGLATDDMPNLVASLQNANNENKTFAELVDDVAKEHEKANAAITKNTSNIEDNSEALEKEEKRLEKLADTRESSVRKLIDIDQKYKDNSQEVWQDWQDDQLKVYEDWQSKRSDIISKAHKDAAKMWREYTKDITRQDRDLGTDLRRSQEDENLKIKRLREDTQKDTKQERKKKHLEEVQDKRLFEFELRQLAAQGDAAAIQQALERRAIEEQISKEKAQLEADNEKTDNDTKIQRIKEDAELERQRKKEDAATRRADQEQDFEEEKILREAALQEAIDDEKTNYEERQIELAHHRQEKLDQLEQDKQDSIEKLGEQLSGMKDITKQELGELAKVFNEYGEEAGNAFSAGLEKGFDVNKQLEVLLGQKVGSQAKISTTGGRSAGFGKNPSTLSFAEGGIVPGPIGQPQLAIVHGGEEIRNPQQQSKGNITFVLHNPVFGNAVTYQEVEGMFQEYTDVHLREILN